MKIEWLIKKMYENMENYRLSGEDFYRRQAKAYYKKALEECENEKLQEIRASKP